MAIHTQRRQVFTLGLAVVMAVAAYWVPTPKRRPILEIEPGLSNPERASDYPEFLKNLNSGSSKKIS